MNIAHKSTFVLGSRHLLGIEGLSHADIVGLLDLERYQGAPLSVAALMDRSSGHAVRAAVAGLSDADLDRVRSRRNELFAMWEALPDEMSCARLRIMQAADRHSADDFRL